MSYLTPIQDFSVNVCREVFGEANMTSQEERKLRFAEEAVELLRACGMDREKLMEIVNYEYDERKPGEIPQEIAGVQNTLFGLANAYDYDVGLQLDIENRRLLRDKEKIQAKHNDKPARFVAERVNAA